jgi:hypothetical protein
VRWFPWFAINAPDNWLPRQRVQYAKLLAQIAKDSGATAAARADAIRRSARLGTGGEATVQRFLASRDVQLQEAALGAVVWLPDPAAAIPMLLEYTDGDRARVAVYALTRAARYARPSAMEEQLRSVLTRPTAKITSRKEALRIAAQVGVPHLVELLLDTWHSERQHRHVRMAAVTRLVAELDDPRVRPALAEATAADRDVALELLRTAPLNLPARHRAVYGTLVAELCTHPEILVRATARQQVAAWYPWAPEAAAAIETAILDVASTDAPPIAAVGQLVAVGWPTDRYLRLVRRLLESASAERDAATAPALTSPPTAADAVLAADPALATDPAGTSGPVAVTAPATSAAAGPEASAPATPPRDRPARRRLEDLAAQLTPTLRASLEDWRPIVAATADLLAAEPGWLHHASRLQAQALDLIATPEALTAAVKALADLTDARPMAARTAADTLMSRTAGGDPIDPDSFRAAASALAADPRTSAGTLAVALAATAGPGSGWDEAWRAVVRTLRAHRDADVAESALQLRMGQV